MLCLHFNVCFSQWGELGGVLSIRLPHKDSSHPEIYEMTLDDSGNVYATGYFTNADAEYYVLRYTKSTKKWDELGSLVTGGIPLKANGIINRLTTDHLGNVYASGNFTNSFGQTYIAKWDKVSNTWSNLGNQAAGSNILVDKFNNIYVDAYDTTNKGEYIAKWDGSTWSQFGTVLLDSLWTSMVSFGFFRRILMDDLGRVYFAKNGNILINNGTKWTDTINLGLGSGGSAMKWVNTMAIDPDRNIYIGGHLDDDLTSINVVRVDGRTKVVSSLCSKVPSFPKFDKSEIHSIACVSSSEIYVGGMNLYWENPYLFIVKWSKATNEWTKVNGGNDISGLVYSILIDTIDKTGNLYIGGYLYNSSIGVSNNDQFIGEYKHYCNAYFTVIPSGIPHYYTLTNYCYGSGKISYKWNWGDGSAIDTGTTPSHIYPSAGNYQICVEMTDSVGCTSLFCTPAHSYLAKTTGDMVYISVVKGVVADINDAQILDKQFAINPNPSNGLITITSTYSLQNVTARVYDILGRVISQQQVSFLNNQARVKIDVPQGSYIIELKDEYGNTHRQRILIQ